jgi:hypothetical protein
MDLVGAKLCRLERDHSCDQLRFEHGNKNQALKKREIS